jgi:TetR/AcrR family transcriptional regulator, ethionamide resistance regulator
MYPRRASYHACDAKSNTASHRRYDDPVGATARRVRYRKQREDTRRQILDAAAGFLREQPFRELSVDALMSEVGLTRTAFYRHFDDTTELLLRLLEELVSRLYPVAERWRAVAGANYPDAAREALGGVVDVFVSDGPLLRAIAEAASLDDRIETASREIMEGFIGLTAATLDRLVAEGRIDVPDTLALARALNLMNEAYLLEEFGRAPFGDRDTALATVERIWLMAAGPR